MTARERLHALLEARSGIEPSRGGIDNNLDAFLAKRVPETRAGNLDEYVTLLACDAVELERLLDAITVTHTWFMRDPGQLAIISELLALRPASAPPLRVWVPGCATGEDAYSVAILAELAGRAVQVLGTDINSGALRSARAGCFGSWSVRELSDVDRFFDRGERSTFRIASRFKGAVSFERHNLLDPPPSSDWDVVLCRNVLIYIARPRARRVIEALADALAPGGHLLLGASEVLFDVPAPLEAVYRCDRLALRRRAVTATAAAATSLVPRPLGRDWQPPLAALPERVASITEQPPARAGSLDSGALLSRGHELLDRSELAAAITEYELAVESDPTAAEPHLYLGIALYLDGAIDAALHELRAAAFLDDALWPAIFYSAVCHEALGRPEDARREYQHVVRVAARASSRAPAGRHGAWHRDLLELARERAGSAA